jgi:hypothetical protein
MLRRVVWYILIDVSEELTMSIIREEEEVEIPSETSVNIYQTTRRNIPEDNHLHTLRRKSLKVHQNITVLHRSGC